MQTAQRHPATPKANRAAPEIIFAHWRERLSQAGLAAPLGRVYAQAIEWYLEFCRLNGLSVGVETARGFMADAVRRKLTRDEEAWKGALNWFFREGRKRSAPSPEGVPVPGQADQGVPGLRVFPGGGG
jgi:hypothetical protein